MNVVERVGITAFLMIAVATAVGFVLVVASIFVAHPIPMSIVAALAVICWLLAPHAHRWMTR